jgi:hypothetical protein
MCFPFIRQLAYASDLKSVYKTHRSTLILQHLHLHLHALQLDHVQRKLTRPCSCLLCELAEHGRRCDHMSQLQARSFSLGLSARL